MPSPLQRNRTRGVTFVEILIASAILAAAVVPIAGYMRTNMKQQRYEKMEAAISSYVTAKLNDYLVTKDWADVADGSGTDHLDRDGTKIVVEWSVKVSAVITKTSKFSFDHIKYHSPSGCASGKERHSSDTDIKDGGPKQVTLAKLERDTAAGTDTNDYLREIELTVRWKWPGEEFDDRRRKAHFVTRRANLK